MKKLLGAISLTALMATAPAIAAPQKEFSKDEKAAIEAVIKDYLLTNPEILIDVQRILMEKQEAKDMAAMADKVKENWDALAHDDISAVLGNPDGAITIVEFFDYRCGYCRRSHPDVKKILAENKDVRLVMKQFPILDQPEETPISLIAAHIAQAMKKQGKFEAFHDAVFEMDGPVTQDSLMALVDSMDIDKDQYQKDFIAEETSNYIRANHNMARELGISSTPMFFINGKVVSGARGYDHLNEVVEEARAALN